MEKMTCDRAIKLPEKPEKKVMIIKVKIKSGASIWDAEIYDTATGRLICQALPIKGRASRWGGEIYFAIPVEADLEPEAREEVAGGDLGYWPTGRAFCIFFGRTPVSRGDEIRAASAVNIFGMVKSNLDSLYQVADGADIVIE